MKGRTTMGLDCKVWKHHLVENLSRVRNLFLRSVLLLGFSFGTLIFNLEVRTESIEDYLNVASLPRKPSSENGLIVSSFPSNSLPLEYPIKPDRDIEQIPFSLQEAIQQYIYYYQDAGRETFKKALKRSWPYVSVMSTILKSYGLPSELVYVVLVESRFRNKSLSHKGAAGQWQLMPITARSLGLRVDAWVDERRDPIKSTHAAAMYLRRLYERFGSWPLALAAYNGGQTALKEAMEKYETTDFWELCQLRALPEEVRGYVPKVFAAIAITKNLEAYGLKRPRYPPIYTFDSVRVWNPLELELVAQWIDASVAHLRALNPSLRQDRLPPGKESFILRLPPGLVKDKFHVAYRNYLRKSNNGKESRDFLISDRPIHYE
jgi:membrane-bound lytic murein transglycosylase D